MIAMKKPTACSSLRRTHAGGAPRTFIAPLTVAAAVVLTACGGSPSDPYEAFHQEVVKITGNEQITQAQTDEFTILCGSQEPLNEEFKVLAIQEELELDTASPAKRIYDYMLENVCSSEAPGAAPAPTEISSDEAAPTEAAEPTSEAPAGEVANEEEADDVLADNADYDAHRADILKVLTPIYGESMANDLVSGQNSAFTNEGLRQLCVIWQSGSTVTSEGSSDENLAQVYTVTGASEERAAALVESLKKNVCAR